MTMTSCGFSSEVLMSKHIKITLCTLYVEFLSEQPVSLWYLFLHHNVKKRKEIYTFVYMYEYI